MKDCVDKSVYIEIVTYLMVLEDWLSVLSFSPLYAISDPRQCTFILCLSLPDYPHTAFL